MRIEVDKQTEDMLNKIREGNWSIGGKGHTDTIRFLAQFHQEHQSIETLLNTELKLIEGKVETAVRQVFRSVVLNLLQEPEPKTG